MAVQYKEILENWEQFMKMIEHPTDIQYELIATMVKRYSDQNIEIVNEVLASSIEHLTRLKNVKTMNDVVCVQARLTDDINKKLVKTAQKFFDTSLGSLTDYNEWLKAHCDLATD
jgi:hypothetical protein